MKLRKLLFAFLFSIILTPFCFAQDNVIEIVEGENWVSETIYPNFVITFRYDRYSRADTEKFREKLASIRSSESKDEWSGVYVVGTEETVNRSQLLIDSKIGFTEFNIYTCKPELRYLNFGNVLNKRDSIELSPESVDKNSPRKLTGEKYVKIRWGSRYLLVEESALSAFAEKAVGIYLEPENGIAENSLKWANFWIKADSTDNDDLDSEIKFTGLPVLPANYAMYKRYPIETKLVSVAEPVIKPDESYVGTQAKEVSLYKVTLGAGKNLGVKTGMTFDIPEISAKLLIIEVNQTSAFGEIVRDLDENQNELCYDRNYRSIDCLKIKPALKAQTRVGDFSY